MPSDYNDEDIYWSITNPSDHDDLVRIMNEELLAWDGVLYSRQAYDRWHWYDQDEMNRFVTYFTLKHGDK